MAEEQIRLSFDAAPIGVALVDIDGRFLRVNRALCEIVGYEADELLALTFQEITDPRDLDADLELVQAALRGRIDRYTMEKRYRRRDGDTVVVQLDVSLVRDGTGRPLHFIAHIQDITERKATEEALLATQATQSASLDALEQGVALVSLTGEVKLMNRAGQRIIGFTPAEMTERFQSGWWDAYREDGTLMPPEDRPVARTILTGQPTSDHVVAWRTGTGDLIMLRVASEPVVDDHGELVGVVIAFADITAQREAERAEQEAIDELEWRATHDQLTRLPNRGLLLDRLERRLSDEPSTPGWPQTALLFVDLDHFKVVNDTLGHEAGDELLVVVADRLRRAIRRGDTVARFGGDEFVVMAAGLESRDAAERLAERIAEALSNPVVLAAGPVAISASIGIAYDDGLTPEALLRDADAALYRAKEAGRQGYAVHRA